MGAYDILLSFCIYTALSCAGTHGSVTGGSGADLGSLSREDALYGNASYDASVHWFFGYHGLCGSGLLLRDPIHHRSSGEALYHYYKDFGICGHRYVTGIVGCHRAFGISDGTVSCIAPPFDPFDGKEKPDHDQWKIHAAEHCGSTKMADPTDDPDIDLRDRDHRDPISFGDRHFLHTEYGKVCLRRGEPDRQILAECLHPFDDP